MKTTTFYSNPKYVLLAWTFLAFFRLNAQSNATFCVMELYTSEGCSSCPSADNMLNQASTLEEQSLTTNNIFIAEHIKYWDYLGWTDPYGNNAYDAMFSDYKNGGNGITYANGNGYGTPLTVRNGEYGQNYTTQTVTTTATAFVTVSFNSMINNTAKVNYSLSGDLTNTEVRFFLLERDLVSVVTAGENAGKTLTHQNVARNMVVLPSPAANTQGTINLQIPSNGVVQNMRVAAYIRKKTSSPWSRQIIGATKGFKLNAVAILENTSNQEGTLSIYPNPAENTLCLKSESENIERISVLDLVGNVVIDNVRINSTIGILDVSKLSPGIYFTRFFVNGLPVQRKFVKR